MSDWDTDRPRNVASRYRNDNASGGISGVIIQDEGVPLATAATTIDFVGAGVTASGVGAVKTVTISGGGGPTAMGNDCSGNTNTCQVDSFKSGVPLSGSVAQANVGVGTVLPGALTSNNTAVGFDALNSMTDLGGVANNSAFGSNALTALTDGYSNTAVGSHSQRFVTSGTNNASVGHNALASCTVGLENVAVGSGALNTLDFGTENTAVGHQALYLSTMDQNCAVGFQAGDDLTTGIRNTLLGCRTDTNAPTDNNCISIGFGAISGPWVAATQAPVALTVEATALTGTTPAFPANVTNLLRVRINGVNYTIPLIADQ